MHGPGIVRSAARPIRGRIPPFTAWKRPRIYGSLYDYHRNDDFDARAFFDPVGRRLPEYKRNRFGGPLGIPATDRRTLFGTYDGRCINRGSTLLPHVPSPEMKKGDFNPPDAPLRSAWTGGPFPQGRIPESLGHPAAVKLTAVVPDPNRDHPARHFVSNRPFLDDRDTIAARGDYEFSGEDKVFADCAPAERRGFEVPSRIFGLGSQGKERDFTLNLVRELGPELAASMGLRFNREAGMERADLRRTRGRAFVRDQWKVNRKLGGSTAPAYDYTAFPRRIARHGRVLRGSGPEPPGLLPGKGDRCRRSAAGTGASARPQAESRLRALRHSAGRVAQAAFPRLCRAGGSQVHADPPPEPAIPATRETCAPNGRRAARRPASSD